MVGINTRWTICRTHLGGHPVPHADGSRALGHLALQKSEDSGDCRRSRYAFAADSFEAVGDENEDASSCPDARAAWSCVGDMEVSARCEAAGEAARELALVDGVLGNHRGRDGRHQCSKQND